MSNKCTITQAVTPTVLELIKQNPTDEIARTLVYANIRQPLPAELKTFPEIQAWIEANITPKNNDHTYSPGSFIASQPDRPPEPNAVAVMVTCTERVWGTCRFDRTHSGSGEYGLTDRRLADLADGVIEDEEGWDEFVNSVGREISRQAINHPPPTEPVPGRSEYSEHEEEDSDGMETDLSMEELNTRLREWIRTHPLLAEGLHV